MQFDQSDLAAALDAASDDVLDSLPFGVIGFDPEGLVTRYNATESESVCYKRDRVLGRHLFTDVAPCMNNYLVAHRFDEEAAIDDQIEYTFTFRVRPTPVRLRLLKAPGQTTRYVAVLR